MSVADEIVHQRRQHSNALRVACSTEQYYCKYNVIHLLCKLTIVP